LKKVKLKEISSIRGLEKEKKDWGKDGAEREKRRGGKVAQPARI